MAGRIDAPVGASSLGLSLVAGAPRNSGRYLYARAGNAPAPTYLDDDLVAGLFESHPLLGSAPSCRVVCPSGHSNDWCLEPGDAFLENQLSRGDNYRRCYSYHVNGWLFCLAGNVIGAVGRLGSRAPGATYPSPGCLWLADRRTDCFGSGSWRFA